MRVFVASLVQRTAEIHGVPFQGVGLTRESALTQLRIAVIAHFSELLAASYMTAAEKVEYASQSAPSKKSEDGWLVQFGGVEYVLEVKEHEL